ncbi:hypothetical protein ACO1O0_007053 [Amphichorda felina]
MPFVSTTDTAYTLRTKYVRRKFLGYSSRRRNETPNTPVARLIDKKLRSLEPEEEAEEPYIVAVLIALAQRQRRQQQQQEDSAGEGAANEETLTRQSDAHAMPSPGEQEKSQFLEESFEVRLLAVPGTAATKLYIYAARIPSKFLDKFDIPSKFSPSGPISITYCSIPRRAPAKLPEKLRHALRAPIE